ncbi:hypothetical protein [Mycobacterium angelicum]|uniref:Uncharacterized protein n=1 Tax=Mycobacterium angelicum TaxID=470074 RepID=A0A1W9ZA75_MYCAN|nr:hypothetical protein [Mycobacterium angelicum]MCV7196800.1 hypothetical protein [Mycobacterium angelicum]ORA09813.1 hypothetical protein BST12_27315 [Mycobacterium angelicum]
MSDHKIGLKPVGAGIAIASIGVAAAAVLSQGEGSDNTHRMSHEVLFQEDAHPIQAGCFTIAVDRLPD